MKIQRKLEQEKLGKYIRPIVNPPELVAAEYS